jgi:membrane-bound serine protease (ClpP class)
MMNRPLVPRLCLAGWLVLAISPLLSLSPDSLAGPPAAKDKVPGQFFTVTEPITTETISQIKDQTRKVVDRSASAGVEPILVFEIRPGETGPGTTQFGAAYDLSTYISTKLPGARLTVAFVPEPLKGYAALAALACDEIVMGTDASIGPITPDGQVVDPAQRELVRQLAIRKGRDPDLLLGMLDRDADLCAVRTADKQLHFVRPENLVAFKASHQVLEEAPVWEGGRRGTLTASGAREQGFSKLTAANTAEVLSTYHLGGSAASNDPTLNQDLRPVWIQIQGPIDSVKKSYLSRRIEQARQEQVNLVFFQINSQGGIPGAADAVADLIAGIKDMKTVAFVDDRALGVAALAALACNEIVLTKKAILGDVHQLIAGRDNQAQELEARDVQALAGKAANLAEQKGHPVAVARAMVDPAAVLLEAKDSNTGAPCFVLQSQVQAEPGRYLETVVRKEAGSVLTVSGDEAATYGIGQIVGDVEELKSLYGLRGKPIRVDGPTWVDSLVTLLTDPIVSWLLLFVGLFMLVLELKLPGIGLPAITSALAFMLFFWSRYLSGTADQLEIILFLVGLVCLALELFVFPGFGVFGMSGVLLILTSIVMASHTFVWPTQEYEYREMGYTLIQVTVAMVAVAGGAALLGRYFPSLPLFNRLVLKAEPWTAVEDPTAKPQLDGYDSLAFLIGETGRTTTLLRPSGKARFGDKLIDVTADGFFIEPDSLVEVVDVQGSRVIVKQVVD